uniref:Uncharacterized protein n=1 Tax=Nelumbo nucifera TaxID=4432 RepID=A0A822YN56_NELNU|nr:TPA_asm: hypothetical protein HUJ06_004670 [Nelumbo nucifera]
MRTETMILVDELIVFYDDDDGQAGFSMGTTAYMSFMFSVTTPTGIVLGLMIFYMTGYDDSSPKALILEGLLGSLCPGVLIYMGLVDLIAVDFFHNKMMSSKP